MDIYIYIYKYVCMHVSSPVRVHSVGVLADVDRGLGALFDSPIQLSHFHTIIVLYCHSVIRLMILFM